MAAVGTLFRGLGKLLPSKVLILGMMLFALIGASQAVAANQAVAAESSFSIADFGPTEYSGPYPNLNLMRAHASLSLNLGDHDPNSDIWVQGAVRPISDPADPYHSPPNCSLHTPGPNGEFNTSGQVWNSFVTDREALADFSVGITGTLNIADIWPNTFYLDTSVVPPSSTDTFGGWPYLTWGTDLCINLYRRSRGTDFRGTHSTSSFWTVYKRWMWTALPVPQSQQSQPSQPRANGVKNCKKKFPKGPKRQKCIKKAKKHRGGGGGATDCTPGYSPCIPPGSDVDCAGGGGNGPRYVQGPVKVTGSDPYGLDANNDGVGCET